MRILIVGQWFYPMYEKAIADALHTLGHSVMALSWHNYFKSVCGRLEAKYCLVGPMTYRFNRDLLNYVTSHKPNIVLVWRGTNIMPATLKKLKNRGVEKIASYNHDDFSGPESGAPVPWHHHRFWRLFLKCAPLYDNHFVKRESNVDYLMSIGVKAAYIMPMWFDPRIHRPVALNRSERDRFDTDVVFVGHYEPDGRETSIRSLVEAGIRTKIWGGHYWRRSVLGNLYDRLGPIVPAEGDDYTKALCGAKVCLCFLSKMNRDTYTRRCFEIPACGRIMLAERTPDLQRMFKEDEEACFFSSNEELVEKARWLIDNPALRERIARAGLQRVWDDGHDVTSRAKSLLAALNGACSSSAEN